MQPCKLVEGAGWKEHFAAVVRIFTVRPRQHGDGVAAEIFVEASSRTATTHGLVCSHGVVFAVEVGVELRMLVEVARSGGVVLAMMRRVRPGVTTALLERLLTFTVVQVGYEGVWWQFVESDRQLMTNHSEDGTVA